MWAWISQILDWLQYTQLHSPMSAGTSLVKLLLPRHKCINCFRSPISVGTLVSSLCLKSSQVNWLSLPISEGIGPSILFGDGNLWSSWLFARSSPVSCSNLPISDGRVPWREQSFMMIFLRDGSAPNSGGSVPLNKVLSVNIREWHRFKRSM